MKRYYISADGGNTWTTQYLTAAEAGQEQDNGYLVSSNPNFPAALKMWFAFADVPMNPDTECIEDVFANFPAGTHREDIWHWFESEFCVSVAKDLMNL